MFDSPYRFNQRFANISTACEMQGHARYISDYKHKTHVSYSDCSNSDGISRSIPIDQWGDNHRGLDIWNRENVKERGTLNRYSSISGSRENAKKNEILVRSTEEPVPSTSQQQTVQPTFSTYEYGVLPNKLISNSRTSTVSNMNQYNMMAATTMDLPFTVTTLNEMSMTPYNFAGNPIPTTKPVATCREMNPYSGTCINPFVSTGMKNNVIGMPGIRNLTNIGGVSEQENVRMGSLHDVIHLSKSVLYPPNPGDPSPVPQDKPPGCKTVFVGGLPENATEEIIKEVFERCGEIDAIHKRKNNFCHIRFVSESHVAKALLLSGYTIKIENKDEAPFTGRLRVDYAQDRVDRYEYECQQRALLREARHKKRLEQEHKRSPTPPVVRYSDSEATVLSEKLRGEETFKQAVLILITWLERGECKKRNSGFFYSMIQSTNSHVRRLMNEKMKYEDELNKAKVMLKQQTQGIILQFDEIKKVFNAASLQKVWDQFTKAQRKNIALWKKQTEEIKNANVEEAINDRIEDEMDLSEDESSTKKSEDGSTDKHTDSISELINLRKENDLLRRQLAVAHNGTKQLSSEKEQDEHFQELHLKTLQSVQGNQNEMLSLTQKRTKDEAELKELQILKARCSDDLHKDRDYRVSKNDSVGVNIERSSLEFSTSVSSCSEVTVSVTESETRLICLISSFLIVNPFGASLYCICSYLQRNHCFFMDRDVESLLKRFPSVFKEESTDIGSSLEKKWTFHGFKVHI